MEEMTKAVDVDRKIIDNLKMAKMATEMKTLNEMKEKAVEAKSSVLNNNDDSERIEKLLDERIDKFESLEEINALSDEEVNELFIDEDGEEIDVVIDLKTEADKVAFKRDYIGLIWSSNRSIKEIDASLEEYKAAIAESKEELDEIMEKFSHSTDIYHNNIKEAYERETDPVRKKNLKEMLDSFEVFPVLETLLNRLKSLPRPQNSYGDYKSLDRHRKLYIKYRDVSEKLDLKTDLAKYGKFEEKFLPEEYHDYPNLFIFLVMKMYACLPKHRKEVEGLFIAQFAIILQDLFAGTIDDDKKEHLINTAKEFIDTVVGKESQE